jgi:hypothetical protein
LCVHPKKGDSPYKKGESSFRKPIHPSKRVNGRVKSVIHPSKGEWGARKIHFSQNLPQNLTPSRKVNEFFKKMFILLDNLPFEKGEWKVESRLEA